MRTSLLLLALLLPACELFEDPPPFTDLSVPSSSSDTARQRNDSQETLAPYYDTLTYPSDWSETTRRRP
jgi:hypothetical protein